MKRGVGRRLTEKVRFSQDSKEAGASDADVGAAVWSSPAVLRTARAEGGGRRSKRMEAAEGAVETTMRTSAFTLGEKGAASGFEVRQDPPGAFVPVLALPGTRHDTWSKLGHPPTPRRGLHLPQE